jgi:hypothetical protein
MTPLACTDLFSTMRSMTGSPARSKIAFGQISDAITVVTYNLDYDGYRHLLTFGSLVFVTFGPDGPEPDIAGRASRQKTPRRSTAASPRCAWRTPRAAPHSKQWNNVLRAT